MAYRYKVMCSYECCISSKSIYSSLLTWRDNFLKHLKYRSHNAQKRRSGKISSRIFETFKNAVQPHGCHIQDNAADMAMATMCTCTYKNHGIPHRKCVFRFCDKCPSIALPSQEANKDTTNTYPTVIFNVYCNVSRCNAHDWRPYYEQTTCWLCSTVTSSERTSKLYTQRGLVLIETSLT